jgi:hypothetical protein
MALDPEFRGFLRQIDFMFGIGYPASLPAWRHICMGRD